MTENIEETAQNTVNRAKIVKVLSNLIWKFADRATTDRCRSLEGDETRLKFARCVAQLATPLLAAIRDEELNDIKQRLDELESLQNGDKQNV